MEIDFFKLPVLVNKQDEQNLSKETESKKGKGSPFVFKLMIALAIPLLLGFLISITIFHFTNSQVNKVSSAESSIVISEVKHIHTVANEEDKNKISNIEAIKELTEKDLQNVNYKIKSAKKAELEHLLRIYYIYEFFNNENVEKMKQCRLDVLKISNAIVNHFNSRLFLVGTTFKMIKMGNKAKYPTDYDGIFGPDSLLKWHYSDQPKKISYSSLIPDNIYTEYAGNVTNKNEMQVDNYVNEKMKSKNVLFDVNQ
jgi:hypothetical protein